MIHIRGNHLQREISYTRESLIQGNPLYKETPYMWKPLWNEMPWEGQPQEIVGKWKSLIQGNPWYRGMICTRGTPLNIRGNHLQMEINYIRKPLIYGNSCKVNALFNKGAHPRPSLFRGIKCTFENIKNHRGNQINQNNQRGQGNNCQTP